MTETTAPPGESYSIGEAARMLEVSVATIRNWERAGKITCIREPDDVPRPGPKDQRRVPAAEVDRIRASREWQRPGEGA